MRRREPRSFFLALIHREGAFTAVCSCPPAGLQPPEAKSHGARGGSGGWPHCGARGWSALLRLARGPAGRA